MKKTTPTARSSRWRRLVCWYLGAHAWSEWRVNRTKTQTHRWCKRCDRVERLLLPSEPAKLADTGVRAATLPGGRLPPVVPRAQFSFRPATDVGHVPSA